MMSITYNWYFVNFCFHILESHSVLWKRDFPRLTPLESPDALFISRSPLAEKDSIRKEMKQCERSTS